MTDTAAEAWQHWTESRSAAVSAPHGPLALTGTHWLESEPAKLPGLPGTWWAESGAVCAELAAGDGVRLEGEQQEVTGRVALRPDTDPGAQIAVLDALRLVPIEREGELALRVFDPDAPSRASFGGISVFPYAPDWAVPAVFTPFESGAQDLVVENADGKARPMTVTGQVAFTLAGQPHTLTVSGSGRSGGPLSGVIADGTSGRETYRFRFITLPAPDADGNTVLDFNRAFLPPCAFADHFICPFPPPGNRLTVSVEAGERHVVTV
ncbi:DUF1684 domain-containing protein [Kitasatospora sp. NPDC059673]|uniref:DUF1684 domain-containing protein n=1 Tax=Kitasatospora sp. NPDC059673 TaxID=3346901 RepID=UPI00368D33ED